MDSWLLFALGASIIWAIVNFLDRFLLSEFNIDPRDYLIIGGLVGIIPITFFILNEKGSLILANNYLYVFFAVLSGVGIGLFSLLYFYALRISSVQLIAVLIRIEPVFILFWGYVFIGETFSTRSYFGGVMLLIAAILAVYAHNPSGSNRYESTKKISKAVILMLGAVIIGSFSTFLLDITLSKFTIAMSYSLQRIGVLLVSFFLLVFRGLSIKKSRTKIFTCVAGVESLNLIGFFLLTMGLFSGSLTLVGFLSSLQPFWVLVITFLGNVIFPNYQGFSDFRINKFVLVLSTIAVLIGMILII